MCVFVRAGGLSSPRVALVCPSPLVSALWLAVQVFVSLPALVCELLSSVQCVLGSCVVTSPLRLSCVSCRRSPSLRLRVVASPPLDWHLAILACASRLADRVHKV